MKTENEVKHSNAFSSAANKGLQVLGSTDLDVQFSRDKSNNDSANNNFSSLSSQIAQINTKADESVNSNISIWRDQVVKRGLQSENDS